MLPKILKNDIRMQALSELTSEEFNSLRSVIKRLNIMDIYNVDASFLPWLAWWFRVDLWDDEWSDDKKREAIANAFIIRKLKGTIWAVERALEISGFDAILTPWYQMTPEGTRGTFKVDAVRMDGQGLNQSDYANCISLVEKNKQGSQHWQMNIKNEPSEGFLFTPAVVRSRKRVVIQTKA
ncbi:phage tail protein I [Vibrio campbellii]|uniref:phage tail protein I n=1 Tax=Vibrio campbellii TaxID=680 RepID=UPI002A35966E|nr:phage tail protein I [Vibrio campbellii]